MAASPNLQVFALYDPLSHAPVTSQTIGLAGIHFVTYKDDQGTALSQPTIENLGDGFYGFTPTFTAGRGILYMIDCGPNVTPDLVSLYLRPEDYALDSMEPAFADLVAEMTGKWEIKATGPDACKLIIYDEGGTAVRKYSLADVNGDPTYVNPFSRTPDP